MILVSWKQIEYCWMATCGDKPCGVSVKVKYYLVLSIGEHWFHMIAEYVPDIKIA